MFGEDSRPAGKEYDAPIVLIEVSNSKTHWAADGDLDVEAIPDDLVFGTDGYGIFVVFLDKKIWYLEHDIPREITYKFFTLKGAGSHDREADLAPYRLDLPQS